MSTPTLEELIAGIVRQEFKAALEPLMGALAGVPKMAYSVPQAAKALGTSTTTVRSLVAAGHLATVPHIEGRILIPVADLRRFAESQMTQLRAVAS